MEPSEINLSSSTAVIELKHTYIWNFASKNIDINNTMQQFTNTVLGVIIIAASCYYLFLITRLFNAVVFCFYNGIPFRKIMKLLVVIILLAIINLVS